jgi:hypothetical protein
MLVVAGVYFLSSAKLEVFSLFLNGISILMVIGLFAVFVPYSFSYYLSLLSAVITPAFNMLVWFVNVQTRLSLSPAISFISILIVGIVILTAHQFTYKENLSDRSFLEGLIVMILFYLFATMLFLSNPSSTDLTAIDSMFIMGIAIFVVVATQIVNMTLRVKMLNERLGIKNRTKKIELYESKLEHSGYDSREIDFIFYYLKPALEDFIVGNFESSFENAFKIVFDGEFDNLYKIADYDDRRKPYARIRNTLAHARARSARVEKVQDIRETKKQLFNGTLDILAIVKEFMDAIAS